MLMLYVIRLLYVYLQIIKPIIGSGRKPSNIVTGVHSFIARSTTPAKVDLKVNAPHLKLFLATATTNWYKLLICVQFEQKHTQNVNLARVNPWPTDVDYSRLSVFLLTDK